MKFIPYNTQSIDNKDIYYVKKVLNSDFLTQGPKAKEFEKKIKEFVKVKYAVASNSGTSSLIIACMSLGLKKNDWIWTSPNSFVASANCGLHCGAKIDFVDIDKNTFNISVTELKKKLIIAKKKGNLPKILIPVHFAGQSCEMSEIYKLSKKYNFRIIEDASHALGAKYRNFFIGSCKYSDICVFSFHPIKSITSGEGGMSLTNNSSLAKKMRLLSAHGIEKNKINSNGKWYYQQKLLGYNFRISDIHAALGVSQLDKLKKFIEKRKKIANIYNERLKKLSLLLPKINKNCSSSYHLYVVRINKKPYLKNRKKLYNYLRKNNIGSQVHYIPIYYHPFYKKMGFKKKYFINNENYYQRTLSLPIYPSLKKREQSKVIKLLKNYEKN